MVNLRRCVGKFAEMNLSRFIPWKSVSEPMVSGIFYGTVTLPFIEPHFLDSIMVGTILGHRMGRELGHGTVAENWPTMGSRKCGPGIKIPSSQREPAVPMNSSRKAGPSAYRASRADPSGAGRARPSHDCLVATGEGCEHGVRHRRRLFGTDLRTADLGTAPIWGQHRFGDSTDLGKSKSLSS